jgi:hypothetical protein
MRRSVLAAESRRGAARGERPCRHDDGGGRLRVNLFASLAKFERAVIRERMQVVCHRRAQADAKAAVRSAGGESGAHDDAAERVHPEGKLRAEQIACGFPGARCIFICAIQAFASAIHMRVAKP